MSDSACYVQIVQFSKLVVRQLGPYSPHKADKVELGIQTNLNHEEYYTRQVDADSMLVVEKVQ